MNFSSNRLPSSAKEIEWYWRHTVSEYYDFSKILVHDIPIDFTKPVDYFALSPEFADQISIIGRRYGFFEQPVALREFELQIFGDLTSNTQIGTLLSNISQLRENAEVYGIYATFVYRDKAVYCAFTICYVDKDFGQEMETAVVEISEDEGAFIQPIYINEEAMDYYSFDDIATLGYWLGNFWMGVQFEMNNPPEETRVIVRRGPISNNSSDQINENQIVLVKRVIPVDEDGDIIEYGSAYSGRRYKCPAWGVQGHYRRYKSGKVIYIAPYTKGKHRNKPDALIEKEYRFVKEKIEEDISSGFLEL